MFKEIIWSGKMAQEVKVLATKPNAVSSIPGPRMVDEKTWCMQNVF